MIRVLERSKEVAQRALLASYETGMSAPFPSSESLQPATQLRRRKASLSEHVKGGWVKGRRLRPLGCKKPRLLNIWRDNSHGAEDKIRTFQQEEQFLPNLPLPQKGPTGPRSQAAHRPATPGTIPPESPLCPPRPKSLFPELPGRSVSISAQKLPDQAAPSTLQSPSLPPPSWPNSLATVPLESREVAQPPTPVDISRVSRWSPDSSPERQVNPVRRLLASLTRGVSNAPHLDWARSARNAREPGPRERVLRPTPDWVTKLEARFSTGSQTLRGKVAMMLRALGRHSGNKLGDQDGREAEKLVCEACGCLTSNEGN